MWFKLSHISKEVLILWPGSDFGLIDFNIQVGSECAENDTSFNQEKAILCLFRYTWKRDTTAGKIFHINISTIWLLQNFKYVGAISNNKSIFR